MFVVAAFIVRITQTFAFIYVVFVAWLGNMFNQSYRKLGISLVRKDNKLLEIGSKIIIINVSECVCYDLT